MPRLSAGRHARGRPHSLERAAARIAASLALSVLLAGCRIEQTPEEYIDHGDRVEIFGPTRELALAGIEAARLTMRQLASTPVAVRIEEISVEPARAPTIAWFNLVIEAPGRDPEPTLYRATGIYRRDAGLWLMDKAHIAGPINPPAEPPPSPSESDAAPAEGG